VIASKGGASETLNTLFTGKAGGTVTVRRTLASTICRIVDPTQVPRLRQLRDASTVMRFRPAHQSMINRRFDDRASCPARKSPRRALARKPRIHSTASGNGGHESGENLTLGTGAHHGWSRTIQRIWLRVRLGPQRMGRSLEKMLKLRVESDPGMFVLLEKGDVWRRKVRVGKSAHCYAYDPRRDIRFPKQ